MILRILVAWKELNPDASLFRVQINNASNDFEVPPGV